MNHIFLRMSYPARLIAVAGVIGFFIYVFVNGLGRELDRTFTNAAAPADHQGGQTESDRAFEEALRNAMTENATDDPEFEAMLRNMGQ